MAIFDFPMHRVATEHPESGPRMQFGDSYMYTAEPTAPDQRIFKLKFPILKYFLGPGDVISLTIQPAINLARLYAFYLEHKTWKSFTYPHPVFGDVQVKFNKPLSIPEGIPQGDGAHADISLEFIEQP